MYSRLHTTLGRGFGFSFLEPSATSRYSLVDPGQRTRKVGTMRGLDATLFKGADTEDIANLAEWFGSQPECAELIQATNGMPPKVKEKMLPRTITASLDVLEQTYFAEQARSQTLAVIPEICLTPVRRIPNVAPSAEVTAARIEDRTHLALAGLNDKTLAQIVAKTGETIDQARERLTAKVRLVYAGDMK